MEVHFPEFKTFLLSLLLILFFDAVWFKFVALHIYPKYENVKIKYASLAWISLALGLSAARPVSSTEAFLYGAGVGLITFGVFNGSELAISEYWRKNWYVSIVDMIWGVTLCSLTCMLVYIAMSNFDNKQ